MTKHLPALGLLACALLLPAQAALAAAATHDTGPVFDLATFSAVSGATSTLTRNDHGVSFTLQTSGLPAGHAVTVWWVVFNHPENCANGPGGLTCGEPDLGVASVQASVLYATGHVIAGNGKASFGASLRIGDTDGALFGPGLLAPRTAHVHLIVHDHGPAEQGQTAQQLHSFDVCNPTCTDLQAAPHEG